MFHFIPDGSGWNKMFHPHPLSNPYFFILRQSVVRPIPKALGGKVPVPAMLLRIVLEEILRQVLEADKRPFSTLAGPRGRLVYCKWEFPLACSSHLMYTPPRS